jgi:hypothetical protein
MKSFLSALVFLLFQTAYGTAQAPALVLPEHPITAQTLQRYFDVCHFVLRNREQIDIQLAAQQKTLPPWYPMTVWRETADAIDALDVTAVALPVYQRYFSEEAGENAIRLFLTPQGQAMLSKVYDQTAAAENAGDPGLEAHLKAIAAAKVDEDAKVRQMMAAMTPKDRRETEIFVQSAEWKRISALGPQIAKEFSEVYLAAQEKAVHEVTARHHDDLVKALRDYRASHPSDPVGK